MSTQPGPTSVETSAVAGTGMMRSLMDRRDWLVNKHDEHKKRVKTVTNVVNGDWFVEWPDLSQTPEAPTVANLIEMGVNHWAAIGGAILPSVHVPISASADRSQAKRGARKRERRLRELWDKSSVSELAAQLWADYAGGGVAILGVWANFAEPDPAKRDPYFIRFDPRHTYPLKNELNQVTELLVARRISKQELKANYPDLFTFFDKTKDEDVEEWFWYSNDRFIHAVVDVGSEGRKAGRARIVTQKENKLGFVPVWETVRPTFDGQRRGVFDQTVHILRTMHRLMTLTIYSTEEHAFPTIAEFDVINPEDFGPGATIHLRSPEARLDRVGPATHFDVKDLVARLSEEAQKQSIMPQQLLGEPGASIASARAINASMGALDARLAVAHKQFEVLFGKCSGFMLAFDEIYCDGDKMIYGDYRDKREAESFVPSRDINGAWEATATYGIGAGSDPANIEMRLSMHMANELVSKETARRQLPFLEDPDKEPLNIAREAAQASILAGVVAASQNGDNTQAAQLLKLLSTNEDTIDSVMEEMVEFIMAPPEPSGGGGQAIAEAESLARGGIPGSAPQGPSGLGLPPLGDLLGGGPPPGPPNQVA